MDRKNKSKLNSLLKAAPKDSVLTTNWLKEQGISNKLAWWYVKSGWFERIAGGAYFFAGNQVTWPGAISAIQQQLKLSIYPGGKTALQLLGKSHYINKELQIVQLFATPQTKIPTWLKAPYWKTLFAIYRPALFNKANSTWQTPFEISGQTLSISTPEKAVLELCYLIPNTVTFEEAALTIENLPRMRPKLLQGLLEACQSYKAKRLLLYFGEYFQHAWVTDLDLERIDLGKGKRVIAGGGCYNDKYQISVPKLDSGK